jgi:hypothetical protein
MVDTVVDLMLSAASTAAELIEAHPLPFVIGLALLAYWSCSAKPHMSGR